MLLVKLIALSSASFALFYPLFFWLHYGVPITKSFHRFGLCMSMILVAVVLPMMMLMDDRTGTIYAGVWMALLGLCVAVFWNRDKVNEWVLLIPSVVGAMLFWRLQASLDLSVLEWGITILAGMIVALITYNTSLGHWYLETKGQVPIQYLTTGVRFLTALMLIRLLVGGIQMATVETTLHGEPVGLWQFMLSLDGMMIWMGLGMGTLLPLVLMFFVEGTLRIKSTTSATGILYAALVCALMGDLSCRYAMISLGIVL